jgi:hypothetical protein
MPYSKCDKMIWKEVEEKYGKDIAGKMIKSKYLSCITLEESQKYPGEVDIPERDISLAYKDVMKYPHNIEEWD